TRAAGIRDPSTATFQKKPDCCTGPGPVANERSDGPAAGGHSHNCFARQSCCTHSKYWWKREPRFWLEAGLELLPTERKTFCPRESVPLDSKARNAAELRSLAAMDIPADSIAHRFG